MKSLEKALNTISLAKKIFLVAGFALTSICTSCGQPDTDTADSLQTRDSVQNITDDYCENISDKVLELESLIEGDTLQPCLNEKLTECHMDIYEIDGLIAKNVTYFKYDKTSQSYCYEYRFVLDKDNVITGIAK